MFCFVILHYKNIEETINSIESIYKLDSKKYKIIVVDNNTLDNSSKNILLNYSKDIIMLDNNYGYSKANNIGIEYAVKKYNPDFVCIMNNDVIIESNDLLSKVEVDYEKYKFDMLGTFINSPSGYSINPFPALITGDNIEKALSKTNKLINIYSNNILTLLLNVYIKIKHLVKKPILKTNGKVLEKNIPLHGCFIIFSKKYINKYKEPVCDDTFLYYEEELLYNRLVKDKLTSIYDPDIKIYHKEEASSHSSNKSKRISKLNRELEKKKSLEIIYKKIVGVVL